MSYRQLRKSGTSMDILKELIAIQQRALAESGIEDLSDIRQGRVDFDTIAYTDSMESVTNGDEVDTDAIAYTDSDTETRQNSGAFQICNEAGAGTGVTQAAIIGYCDIGNEQGDTSL